MASTTTRDLDRSGEERRRGAARGGERRRDLTMAGRGRASPDLGEAQPHRGWASMACTIDYRSLDEGFGGKTYKRKRESQSSAATSVGADGGVAMEIDDSRPSPSKRTAIPSLEDPDRLTTASTFSFGRPTYDEVIARRVSGRKWKHPRRQRASVARVSVKGTSLEERVKQKEIKRAYMESMSKLKEAIRANKVEKRSKREEREKKKQENILNSDEAAEGHQRATFMV